MLDPKIRIIGHIIDAPVVDKELRIIHLGRKPKNGGSPARDSVRIRSEQE
jgi:hypothetical protein